MPSAEPSCQYSHGKRRGDLVGYELQVESALTARKGTYSSRVGAQNSPLLLQWNSFAKQEGGQENIVISGRP